MADAHSEKVSEGAEHLVGVDFEKYVWEGLLGFFVVTNYFAKGFGYVVHNEIEIDVIRLLKNGEDFVHFLSCHRW